MPATTKEDIVALIRDNMLDGNLYGAVTMRAADLADEVAAIIMENVPELQDPDEEEMTS